MDLKIPTKNVDTIMDVYKCESLFVFYVIPNWTDFHKHLYQLSILYFLTHRYTFVHYFLTAFFKYCTESLQFPIRECISPNCIISTDAQILEYFSEEFWVKIFPIPPLYWSSNFDKET